MAENETVLSAAATDAAVSANDDNLIDPAAVGGDKRIVHVTLEFEGAISVTADDIYDMLDAEFPVVKTNKGALDRGCYIFNIGPA